MRTTRLFIASFAVAAAALAGGYYALFRYQFGAPIAAAYELPYWITWKAHLAEQPGKDRILIVGDSSSLFGVDSAAMERAMGRPVINLSLHGGLPLDWLTRFARQVARPGDVVVMPLAWPYYWRDYRVPEEWMVEQIVAWDRDYFEESGFIHQMRYVTALAPKQMWTNIQTVERREDVLKDNPARKLLDDGEVIANIRAADVVPGNSYSYLNLGRQGDMRGACGNLKPQTSFEFGGQKINRHQVDLLKRTSAELERRGVTMVIMPAPTVADAASNGPGYRERLDKAFRALRSAGLNTVGRPEDFYFEPDAFFDTNFHLNCEHAGERTMRMVKLLRPVVGRREL